jgi:nucleotide-binding universal stress UspA family protein
MCVFDSSPRWSATLEAATLLANVTHRALVIDPGGSRRGPLGRIDHVRHMARSVGAEILVTTSAQTAVERLIVPHRSPALAAATGLATLLVPEKTADGLGSRGPDGSALVCGVDDSPAAVAAVEVAGRLSAQLKLRLHLVHAYHPVPPALTIPAPAAAAPFPGPEIERAAREAGWNLLERMDRLLDGQALLRVRRGPAAACLEAYADLFDAPLTVIGAPGRGWMASALAGSVARQLIRRSTRPVMVVPSGRGDGHS